MRIAAAPAPPILRSRPSRNPREARDNELLVRYHRQGDLDAREELAGRFMPVARDLASRYRYTNEPLEDLTQVACLGLMKAIDRFEPGRGTRFMSYAVPTMAGELKRHFRDKGWAVHVPRELQERVLSVNRASEVLSKRLGRSATTAEIAELLGLTTEGVLEALEAGTAYDTASLDSPLSVAEDEGGALIDTLGQEEGGYEFVDLSVAVAPTVNALPEREQEILRLRFVDDLTQREIGERVGVSQMHVSRLLRRALDKVHAAAQAA
ncbi:MAG: SigB/SigF/SigG family RNA polymerase sigma factor [Actinomycetota bacterium]|nr:SigB/SigF/SigG family RNA polymerase sigma factor [Actinomycetota bacterium]